ncbi:MAG TPA: hypothetical protein VN772_00620 [Solirubrobacteraceae bacterium]|nr:hypothetical protein [Solirubrobacteraceae bacterium]
MSTPGDLLRALDPRTPAAARARAQSELEQLTQAAAGAATAARTYRGRTVEELLPHIQRELGSDAIIVRRREGLAGGVFGFFQHPFVEIEAMPGPPRLDVYDDAESAQPPAPVPPPAPPGLQRPLPPSPPAQPAFIPQPPAQEPLLQVGQAPAPEGTGAYVTAHLASLARASRARARERPAAQERPREMPATAPPGLMPRVRERSLTAADVTGEHLPPRPQLPERRSVAPGSHARARARVERSLCGLGMSAELAGELIDGATAHTLPLAPHLGLAQAVRTTLAQRIPVAPPLPVHGAAIVVVGAGGTGKTTCCAALLGAYRKSSTLPAHFATLMRDPERGELQVLLAPQIVKPTPAGSPRALKALRRAKADGLAVLDTPRLSPVDRAGIRELAHLLGELRPERVVVALPATLGATAAAQLLTALRPVGANALAVTHADETDQIGVAVEAACRFGLAPEYMLERARSGGWRVSRLEPSDLAARLLQ